MWVLLYQRSGNAGLVLLQQGLSHGQSIWYRPIEPNRHCIVTIIVAGDNIYVIVREVVTGTMGGKVYNYKSDVLKQSKQANPSRIGSEY